MTLRQALAGTSLTVILESGKTTLSRVVFISGANTSTTDPAKLTLYAVPRGETPSAKHIIIPETELDEKDSIQWHGDLRLSPGDTIQVISDVLDQVAVMVSARFDYVGGRRSG